MERIEEKVTGAFGFVVETHEFFIPAGDAVDLDAEKEKIQILHKETWIWISIRNTLLTITSRFYPTWDFNADPLEKVDFLISGSESLVCRELRRSMDLLKVDAFGMVEVPFVNPPNFVS